MTKFYKRLFSIKEAHNTMFEAFSTMKYFKKARQNETISQDFSERIMLAVTQVNGCEICNYYHTEEALKSGMSDVEIKNLVQGDESTVPTAEIKAIMFAKHYADTLGKVNQQALNEFKKYYGQEQSLAILGAIRIIMMGNAYGIPLSALKRRLKNDAVAKSSLHYEVLILLSFIPSIVIAFVKVIFNSKDVVKNYLLD